LYFITSKYYHHNHHHDHYHHNYHHHNHHHHNYHHNHHHRNHYHHHNHHHNHHYNQVTAGAGGPVTAVKPPAGGKEVPVAAGKKLVANPLSQNQLNIAASMGRPTSTSIPEALIPELCR
jgi:hypothetical protein